jgi:uncharacterized protein
VDDLTNEMKRLHFHAAIVRHRACIDNAPYFGNQVLSEEITGQTNLLQAWVLTPDGCEPEFDIEVSVRTMLAQGVRIAWMHPQEHLFSVRPWCSGPMYAVLQAARLPLMVEYDQLTADEIHDICTAFPRLRLLLLNSPRLGRNRLLYPLLEQHPYLGLCFGPLLSVHGGFTDLCQRFGSERWVFGSGYPNAEGGAALAGLLYSGLSEDAVNAIASENIERWLAEVKDDF